MCFCFLKHSHTNCPCKVIVLVLPQSKRCSFRSTLHGMLYWAAALIAFLFNVVYTENSLYRHYYHNQPFITSCIVELSDSGHNCSLPSDTRLYKDEVFTLMSKITIIPIAVFAELVVSVHATRHHVIGRRYGRRHCFCLHQTIHVLALWNILILLQIFTMCAIPLCVLLLTHPQITFLCWAMFAMMPVGLTLDVAYLMYRCQKPRRRKCYCTIRHCGCMVVHFTMIISAVGLIVMVIALYELMLVAQVQVETGITGIVLFLLSSLPLSVLGWYVKRRYQRAVTNECSETSQSCEEQQPTNVTIQTSDTEDENPLPL